ncbi:unnamed protein product [Allacma fusca]|uniref:G-protein coupled receptors family 1 profile domain-containing protein n=1 Tax=Allacma fusca TaxID=39272 RepID=A0A8J2KI23_9HEXA|nr:unnamed protein product [Allacma fusca]
MDETSTTVTIEILPDTLRMLLICGNVLVTVFATCGNTVAIVVAAKSKFTSAFMKICLLSLSLTDILLALSSTPVDLNQFMNCLHSWNFGKSVCKIFPFVQFLCLLVNSFSLLALAVQRCWSTSIMLTARPYNRAENPSLLFAGIIFGFIWLIPSGFAVPFMWGYGLKTYTCYYYYQSEDFEILSDDFHPLENVHDAPSSVISCNEIYGNATNVPLGKCLDNQNSTSVVAICQQTRTARTLLYHVASGIIMVALIATGIKIYSLIKKMQRLQIFYEKALPPRSLQNIEMVQSIRRLLSCQRRGLRLILYMISLFIVCRLPFWVVILLMELRAGDDRSQVMLSVYFTFHMIASVGGAITPFLYSRSSKVLRSNNHGLSIKPLSSCFAIPCRKFSFNVGEDDD